MSSVKLTQDGGLYRRITMSLVKLTQDGGVYRRITMI